MDDREQQRKIRHRLSVLRHADEVTGNVVATCRHYRAHAGGAEDDLAMAVVIMRMVDAHRAGVIFTVNPAGGGDEMRIEAVDGLAEKLVSGDVTPDGWVVSRLAARRPSIDPMIDEVIGAALDIEASFGGPQDVEWAHDGEHLYIVQARPITTLDEGGALRDGFDSPIGADHTYTTAGIAESMPGVLPPLQWTTAAPLLENGFRHLFDDMGALPALADDVRFLARVEGRAVLSLDLMKAAAVEVPGGSAEEIERQYFGRVVSADGHATEDEPPRRGPFKGLRNMVAGAREINGRRRFRFEARASIDAIERVVADPLARRVFIPGALASGFVVSIFLLVADATARVRGDRGDRRRVTVTGAALAEEVRGGSGAARSTPLGMRPRPVYGVVGLVCPALVVSVIPGAVWNFLNPGGYVADIAWIWAVSMLVTVAVIGIGVQSLRLAPEWVPVAVALVGAGAALRFGLGPESAGVKAVALVVIGIVTPAAIAASWRLRRREGVVNVPSSVRPLLTISPLGTECGLRPVSGASHPAGRESEP